MRRRLYISLAGVVVLCAFSMPLWAAIEIIRQPMDVKVEAGRTATFAVEVGEAPDAIFQWFKNGFSLAGATNRIYTTPRVALADDQSTFRVRIESAGDSVMSQEARLTVVSNERSVVKGFLLAEYFKDIAGGNLDSLRADLKYPDDADVAQPVALFETAANFGDFYGVRLSGWLIPRETAAYYFFISSDGPGELYLSPDENAERQVLIASEPEFNDPRYWVGLDRRPGCAEDACENRSGPILLEAGKRYSIRAEMAESEGADHLAVTWIKEGEALPAVGAPPIGPAFLETMANIALAPALTITNQPVSTNAAAGARATFSVGVVSDPPGVILYQWFRNGEPIEGANSAEYVTPPLTAADNNSVYTVIARNAGVQVESAEAALTVGPGDGNAPTLEIARDETGVRITFTGQLQSAEAVIGPWTAVAGAVSPWRAPAGTGHRFYRASK